MERVEDIIPFVWYDCRRNGKHPVVFDAAQFVPMSFVEFGAAASLQSGGRSASLRVEIESLSGTSAAIRIILLGKRLLFTKSSSWQRDVVLAQ
jgi:hypothetical protein